MFTLLACIVGVFLYISISSRLATLEIEVRKMKKASAPNSQQTVAPAPVAQSSVIAEGGMPQANSVTAMPASAPVQHAPSAVLEERHEASHEIEGGKILAIIGTIAVFIGIAFFLKFAFDNNLIGVTGRIILGYVAGIAAIGLGMFLRPKHQEYADTLIGGGMAVFFLTTFSAHVFYDLISVGVAYVALIIITALSVGVALSLNSKRLATLAFVGAFFTPLIMSPGDVGYMTFFGYLLVVNIGLATISYWHKWNRLNFIGVIGTFMLAFTWYGADVASYAMTSVDSVLVSLFLAAIFVIYTIAGGLHHVVRKEISDQADALLLSLNGLLFAWMGYEILNVYFDGLMGIFMLCISFVYYIAAYISFKSNPEDRTMNLILPAIGTLFFTIAVPLHFDGAFIPVVWIAQALLLFIVEYSIKGKNLYIYGTIVYVIGILNLLVFHTGIPGGDISQFTPIFNERFFLYAFAVVAGYAMAFTASLDSRRHVHETAQVIKLLVSSIAQILGLGIMTMEISTYFSKQEYLLGVDQRSASSAAVSISWALYATALTAIGFICRYKSLRVGGLVLFILTALKIFVDVWSLGQIYRIVASIGFGVIALAASFAYSKFKSRLFADTK